MKTLYLIGGTMGVGKTTLCQYLKGLLPYSVFLDGDWCWDADPFQVTEETKTMVMDNICHLLGNFLAVSAYQNVIFCWVMDQQEILDDILRRLSLEDITVKQISLTCSEEELCRRLRRDIDAELRREDILTRSCDRLARYEILNTIKLDVTGLTVEETATRLLELTGQEHHD